MKSDTLILLSFIWIFFDTRSDQYFSPKKSQNILPSKAFTQASCSPSSEGGASGSWQKERDQISYQTTGAQTGAYFHKASKGPPTETQHETCASSCKLQVPHGAGERDKEKRNWPLQLQPSLCLLSASASPPVAQLTLHSTSSDTLPCPWPPPN